MSNIGSGLSSASESSMQNNFARRRSYLDTPSILQTIDAEIARLKKVRKLLAEDKAPRSQMTSTAKGRAKRRLSPESRARIAEAQRRRWAAVKKSALKNHSSRSGLA